MILHKNPKDFRDAIEAAAQHMKMRPLFIEKDYWVCYILQNLANSEYANSNLTQDQYFKTLKISKF